MKKETNPSKHNYRNLIFDLDNTLVDFSHAEQLALKDLDKRFFSKNKPPVNFAEIYHPINHSLWQQVEAGEITPRQAAQQRFAKSIAKYPHKIETMPQHIADFFENSLAEHTYWFPEIENTLNKLQKKFNLGIITNGLENVQTKKYQLMQIEKWFSCYLVSETVKIAKPNKKIFTMALDKMQAKAENTLMIGDSLSSDYQGAINSNIDFCWVNINNQPFPSNLPRPKYIVKSVTELNKIL